MFTQEQVELAKRGLVFRTLVNVLTKNNATSVPQIKEELRKTHGEYFWNETFVRTVMNDYVTTSVLKVNPNNVYYMAKWPIGKIKTEVPTPAPLTVAAKTPVSNKKAPKAPVKDKWVTNLSISKSKALSMMQNNKGRFFSVQFTKKSDKTLRTMNCQYLSGQTINLGIVKVKEAALLIAKDPNPVRSFDIHTVKRVSIAGNVYKIK